MQLNKKIDSSFEYGDNFKIGSFCIIEKNVVVGNNVEIGNYVFLQENTYIGNNVKIDSYVRSGGNDFIGSGTILKIRTTISPDTVIEEDVFFGPHSMVLHATPEGEHKPVRICKGAYIGACSLVAPGIIIASKVVLGAYSFATKDLLIGGALYFGNPAKLIREGYWKNKVIQNEQ